jgi:hypothetical protein
MKLPQLSKFTKIGLIAVGVAFVLWLGVMLFLTDERSKTDPARKADDRHCPVCGREYPRGVFTADDCPYCKLETLKSGGKSKRAGGPWGGKPVVLMVLGGIFVVLLGLNIFVSLHRRTRRNKPEVYFHLHCPRCSRKIRYRTSQFGKPALCPLCKRPIVFPKPVETGGPWRRMKRWLKLAPS